MSGPKPITGSHAVYYGHPLVVWRAAAMRAHRALQENPNDAGAQRTLQGAQQVLREHVALLDQMNQSANARDMYSAAEYADANKAGPWQAGVANAVDAFSLGSGDEIAGLVASAVPGGMTGQEARDRYRAGRTQLQQEQPLASTVGQVAGAVALGAGTAGALPGLARTIAAGGVLGGSQGAAIGAGALIGGGEGVARGLLSEGDLGQRLGAAGTQGVMGAALGAVGTGVFNRLRLRHARRIASDVKLANETAASELDLASKRAVVSANEARARSIGINADVAEATAPSRIAMAESRARLVPLREEMAQAQAELTRARVSRIPGDMARAQARVDRLAGEMQLHEARVASIPDRARSLTATADLAESRAQLIPLREEMARAQAELTRARVAGIPNQVALAEARVQRIAGDLALHEARVEAIPLNQQMQTDRALLLRFKADRVRQMMAAGNRSPASGTRFTVDQLRQWATQNMDPKDVEGFVAKAVRTPGSGVAPPAIEPAAPRVEAPSAGHAQAIVGEAQMPGSALHDVAGRPIAGTEVMPHDPANAARAAHAQVMAATGDAEAAKLAARNAAGMARGATAELSPAAVDPVHRAMAMDAVLKSEPNVQNQEALMQLLGTMSPTERAGITPYIQRTYPVWWRLLTGGGQ